MREEKKEKLKKLKEGKQGISLGERCYEAYQGKLEDSRERVVLEEESKHAIHECIHGKQVAGVSC